MSLRVDLGRRLACLVLSATVAGTAAAGEVAGHSEARCAAIPSDRYQTGLLFNPEGMQTYYDRSRCMEDLAVELRHATLCGQVVERRSWFLNGSQVSPGACRTRVADQVRRDIEAAARLQPPQRLRNVSMERDNNGRDFALRVRTSGGDGRDLWLTVTAFDATGRERVLHADSLTARSEPEEVRVFIPAMQLSNATGMPADQPVRLRASLERRLVGPDDRAVFAHAPSLALRSSAETTFVPAALHRVVQGL